MRHVLRLRVRSDWFVQLRPMECRRIHPVCARSHGGCPSAVVTLHTHADAPHACSCSLHTGAGQDSAACLLAIVLVISLATTVLCFKYVVCGRVACRIYESLIQPVCSTCVCVRVCVRACVREMQVHSCWYPGGVATSYQRETSAVLWTR